MCTVELCIFALTKEVKIGAEHKMYAVTLIGTLR